MKAARQTKPPRLAAQRRFAVARQALERIVLAGDRGVAFGLAYGALSTISVDHKTDGGWQLRRYLDDRSLSVAGFADAMGVYATQVQEWISGRRVPMHANRKLIEQATGGEVPFDSWRTLPVVIPAQQGSKP